MSSPTTTPPIVSPLDTLIDAAQKLKASVLSQQQTQAAADQANATNQTAIQDVSAKYGDFNRAIQAVQSQEPTPTTPTAAAPPVLRFGKGA